VAAAPLLRHFEHPVTVTVQGVVIDDLGDVVKNAAVNLLFGGNPVGRSDTGDDGTFNMKELQLRIGAYSLRASKPGYATSDENFVVTEDMSNTTRLVTLRLNVAGWEDASLTASELTVEARQPDERRSREQKYVTVEVFFATDRKYQPVKNVYQRFGSLRSDNGELSLGSCQVSIPEGHRIGNLESPIWSVHILDNPERHVVLQTLDKLTDEEFFRRLSSKISSSPNHDAFIFIHGYNVPFGEAVRRTAQIAFDLNFQGSPICYSWPSAGKFSEYMPDEATIEWTIPHLVNFVTDLKPVAGTLHLIAHSMGNRALARALADMTKIQPAVKLNQIFLAAPDIDAGVFRQLASGVIASGRRATLYASSNDVPLAISQQFHGYPRAGEGGDNIVVISGMDTVDASHVPSGFFGHSYYAGTRTVLNDMYEVVKHGEPPPRFGLKQVNKGMKTYWELQP
jgi:esterase/lipase superfamily enzyme